MSWFVVLKQQDPETDLNRPPQTQTPTVQGQLPARASRALSTAGQVAGQVYGAGKGAYQREKTAQARLAPITARSMLQPTQQEQEGRQAYEDWFKETMAADKEKPKDQRMLNYRDPTSRGRVRRGLGKVGGFVSDWTGLQRPRIPFTADKKVRRGREALARDENYKLYQQQMQAESDKLAPAGKPETPEQQTPPQDSSFVDLFGQSDDESFDAEFDTARQRNQELRDENQELSQEVQEQTALDNSPSQEEELPQASKDVLRNQTGTLSDYGLTFTDGSEETPAAKAAREAREKRQAEQDASSKRKTSVQPKLGRGDWRHTLPKDDPDYVPFEEINIGRFAPKASTTAASVNLGESRLDDAKGYGDNLQPDEGKGNLAQHDERLEELRRPKREPRGKETKLDV